MQRRTQASQSVDTVNVHGATATDTLTAGSAEGQGRVEFVLYPDQSVEHHGTGLLEVELVTLHCGLLARGVRVPTVDLESLHLGLLGGVGLHRLGGLDSRIGASKGGGPKQRPRRSEQSRRGAEGGHGGESGDSPEKVKRVIVRREERGQKIVQHRSGGSETSSSKMATK